MSHSVDGGPAWQDDVRRGACRQIADVRFNHTKWETPKVSDEYLDGIMNRSPLIDSTDKAVAWDAVAEKNAKIAALVNALEEIGKEVFTDGTPTKAARTALAALASVRGKI